MKMSYIKLIVLISVFVSSNLMAQKTTCNYSIEGLPSPSQKELQELNSIPALQVNQSIHTKSLPISVDNSEEIYFPPLFLQAGLCCGQAAAVAFGFTYEMCRVRDIDASDINNNYPTHFTWNWENDGYGYTGSSFYHSMEVLRTVGCPTTQEYGGDYAFGGPQRWMDGYDSYYNAMQNRIIGAYSINCATEEGINTFKNWISNHTDGSETGGIGFFYSQYQNPPNNLSSDSPHEGEKVIVSWGSSANHGMCILGYDDNVCWDYNGDGQYTNDIDINSDGVVDVKDWEIGAFKMANTYSSPFFAWMMYKTLADESTQGGIWNHTVNVCEAQEDYNPLLTYKINLYHTNRLRLKIMAGVSTDLSSTTPDYYMEFPIINYQGGELGLEGENTEDGYTLEFGLDVTPLLNIITPSTPARFFFQVIEEEGWGSGEIISFSLVDYTDGTNEVSCSQSNVITTENDITSVYIDYNVDYEMPEITTTELPEAEIYNDYSFQMEADGGLAPYHWEFDLDYDMLTESGSMPSNITTPMSNFNITLPFDFPFYGETYNKILVSNDGYIDFSLEPYNLPYMHKLTVAFMNRKCIAAFYTDMNANVFYDQSSDYFAVRWFDADHVETAVILHSSGEIEYYYANIQIPLTEMFISGTSAGNQSNFEIFPFSNSPDIPEDTKITMNARFAPESFDISETGLITAHPTSEFLAYNLNFKLTDANNLVNRKTIPISTNGLIVSTELHTTDNDSLEWGEQAWYNITLLNATNSVMSNLDINLSCSNIGVSIIMGEQNDINLNPNEEIEISNAFTFETLYDFENEETIPFLLHAVCDQSSWDIEIEEVIFTAFLEETDQFVDDNDNYRLDVDETSDIHFIITNTGGSEIEDLNFTISSNDPFITLNTTSYDVDNLNSGQSVPTIFNITSLPETPIGYVSNITMTIEGANDFVSVLQLHLTIGQIIEDWESGTLTEYSWDFGGVEDWYLVTDTVFEGEYALKSGDIVHDQESELNIVLDVLSSGEISFTRKVSCEESANDNWDYLTFSIDGNEIQRWDGQLDWQEFSYPVNSGTHIFTWIYHKDGSVNSFLDCAWIDNIIFPSILDTPMELVLSIDTIEKYMDSEQIDIDTLYVMNAGGGFLDYSFEILNVIPPQSKSIIGSQVTCNSNAFIMGDTVSWMFTVSNASEDNEWIQQVYFDFPSGVDVTYASDMIDDGLDTLFVSQFVGNGVIINWYGENNDGWGIIHGGESGRCNIDAIIDEDFEGDIEIEYQLQGDIYGSEPHMINGILSLINMGPAIDWLEVSPINGNVIIGETDTIYLTFNTIGMEAGMYECILKVFSDADTVDIPVTLYVDWEVGINTETLLSKVYPNPSIGRFYIETISNEECLLKVYDMYGKLIWEQKNYGEPTYWQAPSSISNGMYLLKISSDTKREVHRLVIQR